MIEASRSLNVIAARIERRTRSLLLPGASKEFPGGGAR